MQIQYEEILTCLLSGAKNKIKFKAIFYMFTLELIPLIFENKFLSIWPWYFIKNT